MLLPSFACFFSFSFFFNDTATTEIYTLSLHDALPIYRRHAELMRCLQIVRQVVEHRGALRHHAAGPREALIGLLCRLGDRKSTRLNSSHPSISYAVFCLKKKKKTTKYKYTTYTTV